MSEVHLEKAPRVPIRTVMITVWTGFALAAFFTVIRFYIRHRYFRKFFIDDALVLFALVNLAAGAALYHFTVPDMYIIELVGAGLVAAPDNMVAMASRYMKMQMTLTTLFWTCLWTVKFSFLAFFHKLGTGLQYQRKYWWVVTVITIGSYIACIVSYPVSCPSFEAGECEDESPWCVDGRPASMETSFRLDVDPGQEIVERELMHPFPGKCDTPWNIKTSLISLRMSTGLDVATDALIIMLPLNLLWRVRMNRGEKLALGGVFSLTVAVMAVAVVRVCVLNRTGQHPELTWLALWSAVESSVAVIVSSLASFKTLFARSKQPQYLHNTGGKKKTNGRQRAIPLGDQGHHLCSVQADRGPRNSRPRDSIGMISLGENFHNLESGEVHVETQVNIVVSPH
ncbi:MAG: hypothetical protein M1823_004839 [Watsoniomyces obsoletus]|nr:MAG: hypothetical protein M1823_004839 [Watsoniomyces obsoletus]